jgi:PHP family Zn ribbon phosphoesterase
LGRKKGIGLVAIPDWTHPLFFREIKKNLSEAAPGIFSLAKTKDENLKKIKFIFATEISSIYSQGGKMRRVHNSIFSPSLETAEKIIGEFERRGFNILSDGRPIIGLSSKELLELILTIDKNSFLVPCHIWTPWFSVFGSKSGFDSLEECFGNLSKQIYAVETGLSSDPVMNWQIKELRHGQLSLPPTHIPAQDRPRSHCFYRKCTRCRP